MSVNKVILFYCFAPVSDPQAVKLWQVALAELCELKGRIIVSPQGINATVAGEIDQVKKYIKRTKEFEPFKRLDIKWADASGDEFPRLKVRIRSELVNFQAADEIRVDAKGVVGTAPRLCPEQVNELVAQRGDDVVFFDGRNSFEAEIGRFKGAVVPDVQTSRDFISEIESGKYDHLKDKAVVTYCTGGVRCEVLSALMKNRGFNEVYQIHGGIVRYGETFGDAGLWEGSLYVFDGREHFEFSPDAKSLGVCQFCSAETSNFENCADPGCTTLSICCTQCIPEAKSKVCSACEQKLVATN